MVVLVSVRAQAFSPLVVTTTGGTLAVLAAGGTATWAHALSRPHPYAGWLRASLRVSPAQLRRLLLQAQSLS